MQHCPHHGPISGTDYKWAALILHWTITQQCNDVQHLVSQYFTVKKNSMNKKLSRLSAGLLGLCHSPWLRRKWKQNDQNPENILHNKQLGNDKTLRNTKVWKEQKTQEGLNKQCNQRRHVRVTTCDNTGSWHDMIPDMVQWWDLLHCGLV